jgi:tetratricopeptide (TPR) repeat protein
VSHPVALAYVERGDFGAGLAEARRALASAENAGQVDLAGHIGLTIAWIELERGNARACARELSKAKQRGAPPARARCLNGLRLCAVGSYEQAVAELSEAAKGLRDDPKWLANALVGRGIARGYLLRLVAADRDFAAAAEILSELGEHERVATCVHNRGFVALQAGDVPRALALFDEASGGLRSGRAEALVDRASALLAAGMTRDAGAALDQAAALLVGRQSRLAEVTLAAGYCALRSGDRDLAAYEARRAQELFRSQRRPAWVAAADALELRTRPTDVAAARWVAGRCLRWGRRIEAAELLVAAAKVAPEPEARQLLMIVEAERTTSTARLRAIGWLARARLATDSRGLFAACNAGMRVVTEYAAAMGAAAAELAAELAGTALGAARRPRTVLTWIERQRINVVRPPVDSADLVALRAAETRGDMKRVAELEDQVRRRSYQTGAVPTRHDCVDDLIGVLGDRIFVSFVAHEGELVACSVADSRVRVHRLGSAADARSEVEALRFALALQLRTGYEDAARRAANALEFQILRPLNIGDRPLVVVPWGGMSGLVWAALPACAGRPVSVAPSAEAWLRATRSRPGHGTVAVVGPGLVHADREAAALGHGTLLRSHQSTVDATLSAMDGADVVHIAAHGRFRDDSPMFSCIQLADGPLYGYDLDRLNRAPRLLVLSACEVARGEVMANVVLGRGGQALIASTIPVPDEQAVDLVTALHQRLRAGETPAVALAEAQLRHGHLGFSCHGSG